MTPPLALPSGGPGRLLAFGLLLVVLGAVWLAAVSPLTAWYADRADRVDERRTLAARMAAIAAGLPELERQATPAANAAPAANALLEGPSDAVAAAVLQGLVGEMATRAGASLSSMEVLPAETTGAYRRIRLRVSVSGGWPVLVALLQAIAGASPRMLVDDVQLRAAPVLAGRGPPPLDGSFTVLAFRSASAGVAQK